MIVCDRCGKPLFYAPKVEIKYVIQREFEPNKMYPAGLDPFQNSYLRYDLCEECRNEFIKECDNFIRQGKFKRELENG